MNYSQALPTIAKRFRPCFEKWCRAHEPLSGGGARRLGRLLDGRIAVWKMGRRDAWRRYFERGERQHRRHECMADIRPEIRSCRTVARCFERLRTELFLTAPRRQAAWRSLLGNWLWRRCRYRAQYFAVSQVQGRQERCHSLGRHDCDYAGSCGDLLRHFPGYFAAYPLRKFGEYSWRHCGAGSCSIVRLSPDRSCSLLCTCAADSDTSSAKHCAASQRRGTEV